MYTRMGWVKGWVVSRCFSMNVTSMKIPVAPLSRRAWTRWVCCVSVVLISTLRESKAAEGVEATVYLQGRRRSQLRMRTQGGVGASVNRGGRGCGTSAEVSTGWHVEELQKGVVLQGSTDRHAKQLELGSGGVQSIHCDTKNPPVCPPHYPPMSSPSPWGKVHPRRPSQLGAP